MTKQFTQVIAHVDMDCFFAACEEKADPSIKGKPVIIGSPKNNKRGVVATANYKAREFGVRSAQPISRAANNCPDGIYLSPNFQLYKKEALRVMNILSKFSTIINQASIDEAYLDITDYCKDKPLERAAADIVRAVYEETKLSCSIGISESKYVAKIASDFRKPAGITVVRDMKKFLSPLSLSKIGGIGEVTMKRLERRQLKYCNDLAGMNKMLVVSKLGTGFSFYHDLVNGLDCSGVTLREGIQKSSSREHTFQEDIKLEECPNVVKQLVNRITKDIQGFSYRTVSIKLRFSDFSTITRDYSYPIQSSKPQAMYAAACQLLSNIEDPRGVRLLGVKVSNLAQRTYEQMTISAYC